MSLTFTFRLPLLSPVSIRAFTVNEETVHTNTLEPWPYNFQRPARGCLPASMREYKFLCDVKKIINNVRLPNRSVDHRVWILSLFDTQRELHAVDDGLSVVHEVTAPGVIWFSCRSVPNGSAVVTIHGSQVLDVFEHAAICVHSRVHRRLRRALHFVLVLTPSRHEAKINHVLRHYPFHPQFFRGVSFSRTALQEPIFSPIVLNEGLELLAGDFPPMDDCPRAGSNTTDEADSD
jgi:hypothetical protein